MKNITFMFITCLLAALACCKKKDPIIKTPEPTIPPITSEGKNTIGCFVNGKLWVLEGAGYKSNVQCEYYPWHDADFLYGTFTVRAFRSIINNDAYITMQLSNRVFSTGKYLLYSSSNAKNQLSYGLELSFYSNYNIDSTNFVNITRLDTVNRIASGTFQYKTINENDKFDTVKVTDGRFDLKF